MQGKKYGYESVYDCKYLFETVNVYVCAYGSRCIFPKLLSRRLVVFIFIYFLKLSFAKTYYQTKLQCSQTIFSFNTLGVFK